MKISTVLKFVLLTMFFQSATAQLKSQTLVAGAGGGVNFSDTVGYSFTVGQSSLRVSALGVYDTLSDGLLFANTVGIWTNAGALIGSVTIPAGTGATLTNNFRWSSVSPFDLISGQTYRIGAFSSTEVRFSGQVPSGGANPTFTTSGDITLIGVVRNNDFSFAFPSESGNAGQAVIGGNAMYSAIPEPSTYAALFGLTALGFAAYRRKNNSV